MVLTAEGRRRKGGRREVDFLVTKNGKPWLLAECKASDTALSPALAEFGLVLGARHVLQTVFDLPYEEIDCFALERPAVVPARTFLAQLP